MRRSLGAALVLTAIALTGCAAMQSNVDPQEGQEVLARATPCCSSLSQIPTVAFDEIRDRIVLLDPSRPVVELGSGKTFVLVVALPEDRTWSQLVVDSHYTGLHIPSSRILYPTIAILDSAKNVIRIVPESVFSFVSETWGEPPRLSGTIALSADSRAEQYVAIYTTAKAAASQRSYTAQTTTGFMVGITPVIVPTQANRTTPGSAVGGIKLKVQSK